MTSSLASTLWLLGTVGIYVAARRLHAWTRHGIATPALVTIAVMITVLARTGTPYAAYDRGGQLLSFWLGPAVVALGVPLAVHLPRLKRHAGAVVAALVCGAAVGIVVAVAVATGVGAPDSVIRSLAPRSATTPIAVLLSARVGGIPALSAMVSIASGAIGGAVGVALLRRVGVRSPLAVGLALGAAAHGLGTARASDEGAVQGAAAGIAMGAVGAFTALLAPSLLTLVSRVLGP